MSMVRASVVNETALAGIAVSLGVGDALRLGRGEDASGGRDKPQILGDALEALIGAVYLDSGFKRARRIVLKHWSEIIAERAESPGERDYKTRLQEVLAQTGSTPGMRWSVPGRTTSEPSRQRSSSTARCWAWEPELRRSERSRWRRGERSKCSATMPELPEVETTRRHLAPVLEGRSSIGQTCGGTG